MSSTDLVNFRDQFLAKTEARLKALDIAAASDTDLLLNSALLKAYAAVNDFDVISTNALSFLTNKTGAQLETALQDPSNRAQFEAILASSTAMTAVAASSTAMTAVAASSTAMTAVWASNTATNAIVASAAARLAVYDSDTALAALQANPTQVQRLIANGATSNVVTYFGANAISVVVANGTKLILLRRYFASASGKDYFDWARGSTTAEAGQGPTGGGRNLDTAALALGCQSGSYVSNGSVPVADDYTGNFVSAANGLQTRASPGATYTVKYILV